MKYRETLAEMLCNISTDEAEDADQLDSTYNSFIAEVAESKKTGGFSYDHPSH